MSAAPRAQAGGTGAVKSSNTTSGPMTVKLAMRPNRRTSTLRAGASRTVRLSLARRPARGSLYGAIGVALTQAGHRVGGLRRGIRLR